MQSVNQELIDLYMKVGKFVSEKAEKEGWGKSTVKQLAEYLAKSESGLKGFSDKNIWRMKQYYETYRTCPVKLSALLRVLPWTHHMFILSGCKTQEEREFYIRLSLRERWSSRELERQIKTCVFERTVLADKKIHQELKNCQQNMSGVFKDKYVFEFIDIPESHHENDLRKKLVVNLKKFILEFGKDFFFVSDEYRIQVGMSDFYIDLLLYHRVLRCFVAVELKSCKFKPEHLGQLNFYLEALDRDVKREEENPSIGILLCKTVDDEVVEYALSRNVSPSLVAEYERKLIPKNILRGKLHELYEQLEESDEVPEQKKLMIKGEVK